MAERNRAEYFKEYYKKNKERLQNYNKNYSKTVVYKKYRKICAFVDRELCDKFDKKLAKDKIGITEFITKKIEEYVKE